MSTFELAMLVTVINNGIVEAFLEPLKLKFPTHDFWWVMYASWVVGAGISFAFGVNLFVEIIANPLFGMIVTAVVVGRGASLLADVIKALSGPGNPNPNPPAFG